MTNPTLERAARAAADVYFGPDVVVGYPTSSVWTDVARAVLMAVRTDLPLIKVGFFPYGGMYDIGRISRDGWESVIDDILGENDDNA